jgi:glycosyltransferase involved in cell wall biosynthesis
MVKISIIIPVYKVESYIQNCLNSLLNQDILPEEYEIICIDDGSPDHTALIIKDYAKKYSNVFYVYQKNQGVSKARNTGLNLATGEYVLFVDGDDSLYSNVLGSLFLEAKTKNLDLLYLQVDYFNEDGLYTSTFSMEATNRSILDGLNHQRRGFVFGLYRRDFIETIRFTEGIPIGEDALFNIMVHLVAQRCSYLPIPAYKYLIRSGSALNSELKYSKKAFNGYLKIIETLIHHIEINKNTFTAEQIKYLDRPLYKTISIAFNSNIIPNLSIKRYFQIKKIISKNNLNRLDNFVETEVSMYSKHWILFFTFYFIKKVKNYIFS